MRIFNPVSLAVCLGLFSVTASAAIYQSVDKDGNVVFSDEPGTDAKPVELPPLPTYTAPKHKPVSQPTPASGEQATTYESLVIQQPAQDATLRDNTGMVSVSAALEPKLNSAAGHRFQFYLDGAAAGGPVTSPSFSFDNVDRGAHQVEVAVIDSSGNELKRSGSVRFYLHRETVNSPTRPKPTPLPTRPPR